MIGVSRFLKVQERHDQACQADLDVAAEVPRVWRLIESVPFCMLSTLSGSGLHSRPMGAYVRRGEACIYFFSKVDAHKCDDIRENRKAWAKFVNPSRHTYVVVSGRAEITYDRKKMQELWSISERLWWKRADNPAACLIKFIPEEAEYLH
jgi:general stress protein 26